MQSARPYLRYAPTTEDYAEQRLRGTVWARVAYAHATYRGFLAFGAALGRLGVGADALTYTSLVFAAAAGVSAAGGSFGLAALLFLVSGVCDVLDGVVARATKTQSAYGALLDSTVDRLSDALPLLGLVVFYAKTGAPAAIPAFAMLGAFTVSYVRARAESLRCTLPPLFMRRAERFVLVVLSLLLGMVAVPAPVPSPLLLLGVAVMAVLNVVGAVWALRAARQALTPVNARREATGP
jgi:CDP-diacylglycerol--glycerol-3-phosphate 3-phosphatidyltransferase